MNVVLTHTDLDGVCSGYLAGIAFETDVVVSSNYNEVRKKLQYLSTDYPSSDLIVTDLNLLPEDLQFALKVFKTVTIFDHHESSSLFEGLGEVNDRFELYFNGNICATTLVYAYMQRNGHSFTKEEQNFFRLVNLYDIWHSEDEDFKYARMANDLFWHYGWRGFYNKLLNQKCFDIPYGLPEAELLTCKAAFEKIDHAGEQAEWYNCASGSTIVMLTNEQKVAINMIPQYKQSETGVYYIVYFSNGVYRASIRIRGDHAGEYPFTNILDAMARDNEFVDNAGGHDNAGGMGFIKKVELAQALEIIEEMDAVLFKGKNIITD